MVSVDTRRYIGCLGNISQSGVFLHTTEKLTPGSVADLTFALPGEERFFTTSGVVKWSSNSVGAKRFLRGCGIMFTSISPQDQQCIEQFVAAESQRL
ncbi:MAG: hypothetical protein GY721_12010 [Deltaproteobacteria bacterium]|nr:hypothetical protein [Deltaproteobacteria bacterium]